MNIIVHYPTDAENQRELQKRVATTHCNAILKYIERLPCPPEQKKEILSQMIRDR